MDSAQPSKASKCRHDHCSRPRPLYSCFSFCPFFLPTMHLDSSTSALKMPVKFLTKGALYVFLLTLLWRLLDSEKVGVWSVRLSWDTNNLWFKKQWWMTKWRANNVFQLVKMYRLSSTSCKYWLKIFLSVQRGFNRSYLIILHHKKISIEEL